MESFLLPAICGIALAAWLLAAWEKRKKRKYRDFTRKLETVLQKKETVEAICPQKGGYVVLTTGRLLFDTREGFQAVPLSKIKSLRGTTPEGKATVSPPKMKQLTIKADHDFCLENTGEDFVQLVKLLKQKNK